METTEQEKPNDCEIKGVATLSVLNITNLSAFIAYMIFVASVLPNAPNVSGSTNYPTLLDVPTFAFAAWGPIYVFEGTYCVWQMFPSVRSTKLVTGGVWFWYIVQCLTGILWTLCNLAPQSPGLDVFTIVLMWVSCLVLVISVRWERIREIESGEAKAMSFGQACARYWLLYSGFSFNLAWLTVASLVNVAEAIGTYQSVSVVISFSVAALVTICIVAFYSGMCLFPGDPALCGMLAWASGSVALQLQNPQKYLDTWFDDTVFSAFSSSFAFTSVFCAICMITAVASTVYLQIYGQETVAKNVEKESV